jgi:hypothetical protein
MLKKVLLDAFGPRDSGRLDGLTFAYRSMAWTLLYAVVMLGLVAIFHRSVGVTIVAIVLAVVVVWQWWVRVASHYRFSDDLRRRDKGT